MVINMVYDHLVKHNGKYYQPGEEVPENKESLFSEEVPEPSDKYIAFDSDVVSGTKTSGRRGSPKKTD